MPKYKAAVLKLVPDAKLVKSKINRPLRPYEYFIENKGEYLSNIIGTFRDYCPRCAWETAYHYLHIQE